MAWIALEQMEFWAYHGCFTEEQVIGTRFMICLLYTSDAADDQLCVNLGGRRIHTKKQPPTNN